MKEWQLALPHHSLKFIDSADFLALPAWTKASYLVLERKVGDLRCRGRVEGVMKKADSWWVRTLGISRRSLRGLASHGLIRIDVDALVLVHYDVEAEVKDTAFRDRQRRLGRSGAAARWGHAGGISEEISSTCVDLTQREDSFDAMPIGNGQGEWPVGQICLESRDPSGESGSPDNPSKTSPLWASSALKRVALASRPTVANMVVRARPSRREVGPAPGAPPARLSARAGQIPRDVRPPVTGPETAGPGVGGADFPDFRRWYNMYVGRTGKPWRRQEAEERWQLLAMTVTERRRCWRFTDLALRRYTTTYKAPNPAAFLKNVWARALQDIRSRARRGEAEPAGDVVAEVFKRLEIVKGGRA